MFAIARALFIYTKYRLGNVEKTSKVHEIREVLVAFLSK